jgi:hypothetical protein
MSLSNYFSNALPLPLGMMTVAIAAQRISNQDYVHVNTEIKRATNPQRLAVGAVNLGKWGFGAIGDRGN